MAGSIRDPQQQPQPKKTNIDIWDVADFMFGTRSIAKIANGGGSWGDLVNVGVSAATFFIAPAKLLKLSPGTLNAVIKGAEKTISNDVASVAAKRAAQRTLDDAMQIRTNRYPNVSEARKEKILGKYPEEKFVPEKTPQIDPEAKFGPRQISDVDEFGNAIEQPTTNFGTGSDKTKKQVAEDIYEAKPKLKPEDIKPVKPTEAERKYLEKFNKEFPQEPVNPPEAGKTPVINRTTGELDFVDPRKLTPEAKIPKKFSVSPEVDQVGYALYKVEQLSRANIALKRSGNLDQVASNLDDIAKFNEQIKTIGKTLSPEDATKAGKLSEQLNSLRSVKKTKFNPQQAQKELDDLRQQWKKTNNPAERKKLQQRGKLIADRLNKMEGK